MFALFQLSFADVYSIGDHVEDFTGTKCSEDGSWRLYDFNGIENGGNYHVVWVILFNASSRPCQLEAPFTQTIYNSYLKDGLTVVGIGSGWNMNYSCEGWENSFDLTYPLVDDHDMLIRTQFTEDNVPHHILIDHNMTVVYSSGGTIMPPEGNDFFIALGNAMEQLEGSLSTKESIIPESVKLNQSFPNPFNANTTISYDVSETQLISLSVYDITGREVKSITQQMHKPGSYRFKWDAGDAGSGIYFVHLKSDKGIQAQKIILIK
tara:strand:+ start:143 stop:937 length:795 start_codon:yes stop_codon:yes gene_type:complete